MSKKALAVACAACAMVALGALAQSSSRTLSGDPLEVSSQAANPLQLYKQSHKSAGSASYEEIFKVDQPSAPNRLAPGQAPRGTFYGNVARSNSIVYYNDIYFGKIDGASGQVSPLYYSGDFCNVGSDYDIEGGTIADGIFYSTSFYQDRDGNTGISWSRFDVATGQQLPAVLFDMDWAGYAYSMTYDPETKIFHTLSFNASSALGFAPAYFQVTLEEVDGQVVPTTKHIKDITLTGNAFACAIAYCPADKQIYAFDSANAMYTVNAVTGSFNKCAQLSDQYLPFEEDVTTPVCFSPLDNAFCIYYRNKAERHMQLLYLDIETFDYIDGPVIVGGGGNPYFCSISCLDPYAKQDAPAMPEPAVPSFDRSSASGKLTFTAPTCYYSGVELPAGTELDVEIAIDGTSLYSGTMKAGESKTFNVELDPGEHHATMTCSLSGDLVSPERDTPFYVGNDNPTAPADLKIDGNTLTWTAPTAVGEHGGYVDVADIIYNVYFDDVKINNIPFSEPTYTFTIPADLKNRKVAVEAISHRMVSKPAIIMAIIGEPLKAPFSLLPTKEEAETFTCLNPNLDDTYFAFHPTLSPPAFMVSAGYVATNLDEWLIMPVCTLDDVDALYTLSFTLRSPIASSLAAQNMTIHLGTSPTVEGMGREIYHDAKLWTQQPKKVEVPFGITEPGTYYIGFHINSPGATGGVILYDFALNNEGTSDVPTDPAVEIVPAPKGQLSATVNLTLPTMDLTGRPLAADREMTVKVVCDGLEKSVTGKPEDKLSVDFEVSKSGTFDFAVTPSNTSGKGAERVYSQYVGLDTPRAPKNTHIEVADDNMSMLLTWDSPGEVGQHGGYVDLTQVTYRVKQRHTNIYNTLGETDGFSYTIYPEVPTGLDFVEVGATAITVINGRSVESSDVDYVKDMLGTPIELPFRETFNPSGFMYSPWTYETEGIYHESGWDNVQALDAEYQSPIFLDGGCFICYSDSENGRPSKAELRIPKVTTMGAKNIAFTLRYWDYPEAPDMHIYARTKEQERIHVADITPQHMARAEWVDYTIPLSDDLLDKGWIMFYLDVDLTGSMTQYGIFDSIVIGQNVDYDLKISSVTGPTEARIGDEPSFTVAMTNSGSSSLAGKLTIELRDESDNVLKSQEVNTRRIAPMQVFEKVVAFDMVTDYDQFKTMKVVATAYAEADQIPGNNKREYSFNVVKASEPVVKDLQGVWNSDKNAAWLTWGEPELLHGDREDFEAYEPFKITDKIGMWKNVDLDGREPALIDGLRWAGDDKPQAWHVVNAEELGVMEDPRLAPHSGKQYIMARCASQIEEDDQTADWLISPEIVGGSQVSFWINTISTSYTEYMQLLYSTTDDKPESFTRLRNISKWGTAAWEPTSYSIPKDAKYIALAYVSFDCFGVMLDDLCITPVQLDKWIVDSYSLWYSEDEANLDFKPVRQRIRDTKVLQSCSGEGGAFVVKARVVNDGYIGEGPKSNVVYMSQSGVNEITQLTGVKGGKGVVTAQGYAGQQLALYTADGKFVKLANLKGDNETIPAEAGIYLVKIGNGYTKILVK